MELIRLKITAGFLTGRIPLSWREVRFGLENELLDPAAAIDLAAEQVAKLGKPTSALVELAGAERDEATQGLIDQLANSEPKMSEDQIREKWLYLTLAWIYEHRDSYSDPLQLVEEVYADFGHPRRIVGFVRYMPMDGPDLGSREANLQRLFERWKQYLDESAGSMRGDASS